MKFLLLTGKAGHFNWLAKSREMRDRGPSRAPTWLAKLLFWVTERRFGRVLEPLRIYSRSSGALTAMATATALQNKGRESMLAQVRVAALVECDF